MEVNKPASSSGKSADVRALSQSLFAFKMDQSRSKIGNHQSNKKMADMLNN